MLLYFERYTGVGLGPGRACLISRVAGNYCVTFQFSRWGKQLVFWRTKTDGGEINNIVR